MRLLSAPLVHFAALGAVLFVLERGLWPDPLPAAERVIELGPGELARLAGEAREQLGRDPAPAELDAFVRAFVDEELLVREARRRGWHRSDPVVQMRLLRDMAFLSGERESDSDTVLEQAFALGLDRSDLVVRRRLAERTRLDLTAAAWDAVPDEAELEALRASHAERLRRPALAQLTQVFLARDRRGGDLERDARALLATLRREAVEPEQAALRGDPFLVPARLPLSSEQALAARLGADFAREALQAPEARWSGPIHSSYGAHLVWVHRRIEARDPALYEVRSELTALWRERREQELLREGLERLRSRVEVVLPEAPSG